MISAKFSGYWAPLPLCVHFTQPIGNVGLQNWTIYSFIFSTPDVFGKRKYRRGVYDNSFHALGDHSPAAAAAAMGVNYPDVANAAAAAAAAGAPAFPTGAAAALGAAAAAAAAAGSSPAAAATPPNPAEAMAMVMSMMGAGKGFETPQQEALKHLFAAGAMREDFGSPAASTPSNPGPSGGGLDVSGGSGGNGEAQEEGVDPTDGEVEEGPVGTDNGFNEVDNMELSGEVLG